MEFDIPNLNLFRANVLEWGRTFSAFAFLDSCNETVGEPKCNLYSQYDMLIGAGAINFFEPETNCFESLEQFYNIKNDWLFGHLNYNLFSETENILPTKNNLNVSGLMNFFLPQSVITVNGNKGTLHSLAYKTKASSRSLISYLTYNKQHSVKPTKFNDLIETVSQQQYFETVGKLQQHIARGDIYEINYCIEFVAEQVQLDPYTLWRSLLSYSPAPFAAFYKLNSSFLLCSSPERFLQKNGRKIISQPIKGTAARHENSTQDELKKRELSTNEKERAENIMITDLVRNDLTKTAEQGSVRVTNLCDVYSFRHVHQMISTIEAQLSEEFSGFGALKHSFPMGSMTGAPKHNAIILADKYEASARGLYSGSVGYIDPNGNFDFNVIIRSMIYNEQVQKLSISAGSAITAQSNALNEYNECLLKIKALRNVLEGFNHHSQ